MAAEPLLLVVELDPTETAFFPVGGSVRFYLSVVEADSRNPIDPDVLTFTVSPPYRTPTTYTYGVGDVVVRISQGMYQADVPITRAGRWLGQYLAELDSVSCGSNTSEVYAYSAGGA